MGGVLVAAGAPSLSDVYAFALTLFAVMVVWVAIKAMHLGSKGGHNHVAPMALSLIFGCVAVFIAGSAVEQAATGQSFLTFFHII